MLRLENRVHTYSIVCAIIPCSLHILQDKGQQWIRENSYESVPEMSKQSIGEKEKIKRTV